MERALEDYSHHMNKLELGIQQGIVLHDEHEDVAEFVAEATYKHTGTLADMYNKVPEQGHQGIQNALEVSKRGYDTQWRT